MAGKEMKPLMIPTFFKTRSEAIEKAKWFIACYPCEECEIWDARGLQLIAIISKQNIV